MLQHEHFEELCAAASIGQASPRELVELELHAMECGSCRQAYFDYLNLAAQQFAAADQDPTLSNIEAQECLNSGLFTRRFLARAQQEGIVFSPHVGEEAKSPALVSVFFRAHAIWRAPALAAAGIVLAALAVTVVYVVRKGVLRNQYAVLYSQQEKNPAPASPAPSLDQRVTELTAEKVKLVAQLDKLSAQLRNVTSELTASNTNLESVSQDRQQLAYEREGLTARLRDVQQKLVESVATAESAQQQSAQLRNRLNDMEPTLVADQIRIQALSEQLAEKSSALDKGRQLLAAGHDVTNLMAARNLHIVDVADTDPHGKTRPAFGRIFFTEGKSLIFYAYDLNEAKIEKANFQYRIWAKKEGPDQPVRRLGMFYTDDKSQRRWVFKCEDPKILTEIDSVFVTLEPANNDPTHPKGQNLMYAYLRGQANHP